MQERKSESMKEVSWTLKMGEKVRTLMVEQEKVGRVHISQYSFYVSQTAGTCEV